jgi:hypothetical protein
VNEVARDVETRLQRPAFGRGWREKVPIRQVLTLRSCCVGGRGEGVALGFRVGVHAGEVEGGEGGLGGGGLPTVAGREGAAVCWSGFREVGRDIRP